MSQRLRLLSECMSDKHSKIDSLDLLQTLSVTGSCQGTTRCTQQHPGRSVSCPIALMAQHCATTLAVSMHAAAS